MTPTEKLIHTAIVAASKSPDVRQQIEALAGGHVFGEARSITHLDGTVLSSSQPIEVVALPAILELIGFLLPIILKLFGGGAGGGLDANTLTALVQTLAELFKKP